MKAIVIVGFLTIGGAAPAWADFGQWKCGTVFEFQDMQISNDGLRVNNFSLSEDVGMLSEGRSEIQFSYSIANRQADTAQISAQVVGFGSKDEPIFALSASPMMSRVSAGKTESAQESVFVTKGDLARVVKVCVRVDN